MNERLGNRGWIEDSKAVMEDVYGIGIDNDGWQPVVDYEGLYMVNQNGDILSLHRNVPLLRKSKRSRQGYMVVTLCKNGVLRSIPIHRIVAMSFLPNPNHLREVNHINENKLDNSVCNLEWCDRRYNVNYGGRIRKQRTSLCKRVIQLTKRDEVIAVFDSTVEASKVTGFSSGSIAECCRGVRRKSVGGYVWRYDANEHE